MATPNYTGAYSKLFPQKMSTNSLLTIYILYVLKERGEYMYGKEIIDAIEARFNSMFKPSHGLIYPILRKLETEELLTAHWEGAGDKKTKRYYRITEEGHAAYNKEAMNFKPTFMQTYFFFNNVMQDLYTLKGGNRYKRPIDAIL